MEELIKLLETTRPEIDFRQGDLTEDGVLDSMDIILIVDAIEQHYHISISPLDIVPENFDSAEAMLSLIEKTS